MLCVGDRVMVLKANGAFGGKIGTIEFVSVIGLIARINLGDAYAAAHTVALAQLPYPKEV